MNIEEAKCCGYCIHAINPNDSRCYRYCKRYEAYVSIDEICDSFKEKEQ